MSQEIKNERNYGIDLLRIVAMFYVVILHCLGNGGLLANCQGNTAQHDIAWFMETWAYCAVDLFAIISGYVCYTEVEKKIKASSYIKMWLQVVFYGVIITLITYLINPEIVSVQDWTRIFFPVTQSLYWYFTAYTGLFIIMPLLNAGVRNCSPKTLKRIFLAMLIFFVCVEIIFPVGTFNSGYSFVWLAIMYLMGAIVKKCDIGKNIKPVVAFVGIVILVAGSCMWKLWGYHFEIFGRLLIRDFMISYTSPTIVGVALLYVIGASKIEFPKILQKIIGFLAPGTFAVYLLYNQRFINGYVVTGNFSHLSAAPVWQLLGVVLGFAAVFVFGSILIDRVRMLLFKVCQIDWMVEKFTEKVDGILTKMGL